MYDCAVIGGGPGGYPASIRASQLGLKTILIEKGDLGGVCLNRGCIPSKALIHAVKTYTHARDGGEMGISGEISIDLRKVQVWKRETVRRLREGIRLLCERNGVEIIHGCARFRSKNEVEVKLPEGERVIPAKNIIIATGSSPIEIPGFRFDGRRVITPTEALEFEELPGSMTVIGGGVSGMEIGVLYASLGVNVSVIEMMNSILPGMEGELARVVTRSAEKKGIRILTSCRAKGIRGDEVVAIQQDGSEIALPGEKVLVVVGRVPNTSDLGVENAGLHPDPKGFIPVDDRCRSAVSNIYAIGDVTGPPMLAHKATFEGIVAAEGIAGGQHPELKRGGVIPSVVYTDPEVVSAGLTEDEAQKKGIRYIVGRFPFSALGRAWASGSTEGFVKVIAAEGDHRILGIHIAGSTVSDLAGECTLIVQHGYTLEEVSSVVHAHPTFGEGITEACESALGTPIHTLKKR